MLRTSWRGCLCVFGLLLLAAPAAAQGVSQRVEDLEARVAALESAIQPRTLTVDCSAGQTVGAALESALAAPRLLIRIQGLCTESVRIRRDDLTLMGVFPGSGLVGADPAQPVLDITASSRVSLMDLALTGGRIGLRLAAGAAVVGSRIAVSLALQNGVEVEESRLRLIESSVAANGAHGVAALGGASVRLFDGVVENNAWDGVRVRDTSIVGGGRLLKIQGNGGRGVFCDPEPAVAQIVSGPGPQPFAINSTHVMNNGAEEINCRGIFVP